MSAIALSAEALAGGGPIAYLISKKRDAERKRLAPSERQNAKARENAAAWSKPSKDL